MLNENNLGGLRILYPRVIDTAAEMTAAERAEQSAICAKLMETAEGSDWAWLVNYKDCLDLYMQDKDLAMKASFHASRFAPSFISPKYCEGVRNPKPITKKKGGKK